MARPNFQPQFVPSSVPSYVKIAGLLGILLLFFGLGCSRQSSHAPVTVTFLDIEYDTPDRLPGLAQDLQAFTQETGIRVKRLPRPEGSLNQLAMWRELLQKGGATPDVYGIDVIWSGIFNRYLLDLQPYFATELGSERPGVAASHSGGEKVVAIRRDDDVGGLVCLAGRRRRCGYRK